MNQRVRVKFTGGREGEATDSVSRSFSPDIWMGSAVTGVLKGYDQLLNLVMDDVEENVQGVQKSCLASDNALR